MTEKVVVIKYGAFSMIMKMSREDYDEMVQHYDDVHIENLNRLGEERFKRVCLREGNKIKNNKKQFEENNSVLDNYCCLIYSLKGFGEDVTFEYVDSDFTTYKYNWIRSRNVPCVGCKIKEGEYSCGRCGLKCYCSRVCQLNDWKKHKKICKYLLKDYTK